jgi:hypothetical protein
MDKPVYRIRLTSGRFDHVVGKLAALDRARELVGEPNASQDQLARHYGVTIERITIGHIAENTFADACYFQNSIGELRRALADYPDKGDIETWGLTEDEWREEIELALAAKIEQLSRHNDT